MTMTKRVLMLAALTAMYVVHPALGFMGLAVGYGYAFGRRTRVTSQTA
jgi:hypothetical protein